MLNRPLKMALVLGAALLWQAGASAGELTLYARDQYNGRDLTVRDEAADLNRAGFNDRASSMVIHSGRWEICEHANFQGRCMVYDQGRYPTLRGFDQRISSVREVHRGRERDRGYSAERDGDRSRRMDGHDGRDWERDRERDRFSERDRERFDDRDRDRERGDAVEIFADAKFRGSRLAVNEDIPKLKRHGFNDRLDSIIVHWGQWEFCVDDNFRGQCVTYGPGRYERMGTMGSILSSMRRVR